MVYSETFRITSNKSQLTFLNKLNDAKRLRISRLIYTTATTNNYFILLILSDWLRNSTYNSTPYTKLITFPRTTLTEFDYENYPTEWHVEFESGHQVGINTLECYINNDPSNDDISDSNPLYIEIEYQ